MNRSLSSFLFARTVKHGRRALASQLRPNLDFDYLLDKANAEAIRKNIALRKGVGDPEPMYQAWEKIERIMEERGQSKITEEEYQRLWDELYEAALLIPNTSHATSPAGDESKNQVVDEWGETIQIKEPKTIEHLVKKWGSLFFPKEACGERSYTLVGPLARLERNLLDYAYKTVIGRGFSPVVISDLVAQSVTKACGVQQKEGAHPMQYRLLGEEGNVLSGTAEMGIAAMLRNRTFKTSELPIRLVSQSRCYRPEISRSAAEAKLYRVHEFTKVEMFVVCAPENSDSELENIVSIQKDIFKKFKNIKARLVNMATEELGASAHRKFDIEAWMPGRKLWGEFLG
ncbi:unnamed protein product, partial [Mesorhabditis spiculigera]